MSGRRLTPAEQALIVLSVRATGNVRIAQAFATGYFYFVDNDDEAKWLDSIMWPASLADGGNEDAPSQIEFPEWTLPETELRSLSITRADS